MPSLASSTGRTTNSIWHLGTAGLPAGAGPGFLFLWHCVPRAPPSRLARYWDGEVGGNLGSRQVGFDKADKGNLHAGGDIVLGVDLECDQSARLPPPAAHIFFPLAGQQGHYYNKMGSSLGWRHLLPASSSTCRRCSCRCSEPTVPLDPRSRFPPTSRHKTGSASSTAGYGHQDQVVAVQTQRAGPI